MSRNEKLRLLLAEYVDFQVIRDNQMAEVPEKEYAVMHTISLNKSAYSNYREKEKTVDYIIEEAARRVEAYFQLDFYADTQLRAEEMAENMLEIILFKKRHDLIRNKFGVSEDDVEISDRTFLEDKQYIYRFGFDININWREIKERKRMLIKEIKHKLEVENGS